MRWHWLKSGAKSAMSFRKMKFLLLSSLVMLLLHSACSTRLSPPQATQEFPGSPPPSIQDITPVEPGVDSTESIVPSPLEGTATPAQVPSLVSIWHSWDEEETQVLIQIVQLFQRQYPSVSVDMLYLPKDELIKRFTAASYNGEGPALVLGPAEWGVALFRQGLAADLSPYVNEALQDSISAPALQACSFQQRYFAIPYAQAGTLLYRNRSIIPAGAASLDEWFDLSAQATRGGRVGSYMDIGAYFSLAHFYAMGGRLLDEAGEPLFDQDDYRLALEWINLLARFEDAGVIEVNGSHHIEFFKQGRAGFIAEGSWRLTEYSQAIGVDNLAIDPWLQGTSGSISGFVLPEVLYANTAVKETSPRDFEAALKFIGFMLTPQVQAWLADAGFIPVRLDYEGDELMQQAVAALNSGVAYPPALESQLKMVYFDVFNAALLDIFQNGQEPFPALQAAHQNIQQRLTELRETQP